MNGEDKQKQGIHLDRLEYQMLDGQEDGSYREGRGDERDEEANVVLVPVS